MNLSQIETPIVLLDHERLVENILWAWGVAEKYRLAFRPEEIGVELTEGFMMEPEASVSALVFHHPDAVYFGVGETRE